MGERSFWKIGFALKEFSTISAAAQHFCILGPRKEAGLKRSSAQGGGVGLVVPNALFLSPCYTVSFETGHSAGVPWPLEGVSQGLASEDVQPRTPQT